MVRKSNGISILQIICRDIKLSATRVAEELSIGRHVFRRHSRPERAPAGEAARTRGTRTHPSDSLESQVRACDAIAACAGAFRHLGCAPRVWLPRWSHVVSSRFDAIRDSYFPGKPRDLIGCATWRSTGSPPPAGNGNLSGCNRQARRPCHARKSELSRTTLRTSSISARAPGDGSVPRRSEIPIWRSVRSSGKSITTRLPSRIS